MDVTPSKQPVLPRRAFVAGGLSAVLAGTAVALGIIGGASQVKTESFQFSRGLSFANDGETQVRVLLTEAMADDRIHVTIIGHTGSAGDQTANLELSEERASLVQTIAVGLGISPDRITARGAGGGAPLSKQNGESDRAYQSRLARVEVSLQLRR